MAFFARNHSRPQLAHADAVRFFASVSKGGLRVDEQLVDLVKEICPGTGIEPESFWFSFGKMVKENHTRNKELLDKRDSIQHKIDEFHQGRAVTKQATPPIEFDKYKKFLKDIGYLVPEKEPFSITTGNGRGSLLDAFYGTDVIPEDGIETMPNRVSSLRSSFSCRWSSQRKGVQPEERGEGKKREEVEGERIEGHGSDSGLSRGVPMDGRNLPPQGRGRLSSPT
eukprot:583115-Hanusia_phi.AAC.5